MGHFVTGIIARPELLAAFAKGHSLHSPIPLTAGLAFLPLRDDDLDSFLAAPITNVTERFTYLSQQLRCELELASANSMLVYFETEYFGGTGGQGAVTYRNGAMAFGPEWAQIGPINGALRTLGVRVAPPAKDEFETVGLHRHRHTEDWLDALDGG